jgi:hypothetical protein
MKEKDVYAELSSIRNLMERSSKFISLSGLSGVLAGIYALAGAIAGYRLVYIEESGLDYRDHYANEPNVLLPLLAIAFTVLVLSIVTAYWMAARKSRKNDEHIWNPVSRRLLSAMALPLVTGGIFILILLFRQEYGIIASACLIFYGLSLVAASHYTYNDVKWLGICEIFLGLLALLMPGYGLIFWTLGFSILHIIYGSIMHFKYDR